jgi:hypothetical protein
MMNLSKKDSSKKGSTQENQNRKILQNEGSQVVCPVCGKLLGEKNLPDTRSVIEEGLYYTGNICIVDSDVKVHYDFVHYIDEDTGVAVEEPHHVTAVIQAVFNSTGECTTFNILQILPAQPE